MFHGYYIITAGIDKVYEPNWEVLVSMVRFSF